MHDTLRHPSGEGDRSVLLRNISWDVYQSLVREVGNDAAPRLTYDNGYLEIEVPGKRHEQLKKLAAAIVESTLQAKEVSFAPLGSTTWNRSEKLKGLEADECYYIGPAADLISSREEIDLSVDPAPNLAIEIDVTGTSIDKLRVYAALGIPEVWRIDEAADVYVHSLAENGEYKRVDRSRELPELDPSILAEHLKSLTTLGHSRSLKKFTEVLPHLLKLQK